MAATTPTDESSEFPVKVTALQENGGRRKNSITTAKYNLLTFFPAQILLLLNPRNRFANFYFLICGFLQMVPEISVTNAGYPYPDIRAAAVWQTLVVMLLFEMYLNAKEEIKRHRSDRETNSQKVAVLHEGAAHFATSTWANVKVGSVVKIYAREYYPADLLLLRGSDPKSMGQCWTNTKPLDGETDTKLRLAPKVAVELLRPLGEADVQVDEGAGGGRSKLHELLGGAYVACEAPNDKVNDFSGQLFLPGQEPQFLQRENMLLRGCQLRNTDWALGLVISTGTDAKINFSADKKSDKVKVGRPRPRHRHRHSHPRHRHPRHRHPRPCHPRLRHPRLRFQVGHTMQMLNKDIMGVAVTLLLLCLVGGLFNTLVDYGGSTVARSSPPWYLEGVEYSVRGAAAPTFVDFMIAFMTYFLLCYQFIPISLYVSLAFVQMLTRLFVVQDLSLYDAEADEPCQVRQVSLLDELGQVSHIFSDKTGTLTSNLMSFRRCYVCGVEYGVGETAIAKSLRAMAEASDRPPEVKVSTRPLPAHGGCSAKSQRYVGFEEAEGAPSLFDALEAQTLFGERHREFMLHQAINHSVLIETVGGREELCASSPDEQAFVAAAEFFGYEFTERRPDVGEVVIKDKRTGETHVVTILEVFPYESSRKRMSVVVRLPPALLAQVGGGPEVRMYCKGADSVVLERLDSNDPLSSAEVCQKMEALLHEWAEVALRTLVWAQRGMPDFKEWHVRYRAASESPAEVAKFKAGKPNAISELQEEAERGLQLQGASAIEDKLQDGVPEVLADLRAAGVKVWMLTGDKVGTAKNIATACNILPPSADVLEITTETFPILGSLRVADLLEAGQKLRAKGSSTRTTAPPDATVLEVILELDKKYPPVAATATAPALAGLKDVRHALAERAQETSRNPAATDRCFVLDEKAIEYLGLVCAYQLTVVGNGARSVVACRARKDQKAQMLELIRYGVPGSCCSWLKMASTLSDDSAPSASLDCLKARAAPTHPGA